MEPSGNYGCSWCDAPTRIQVQATLSVPSGMYRNFTKRNLRQADVQLVCVNWETADFICKKCGRTTSGYGNYVSRLEKEHAELREKVAKLARKWRRSCGRPGGACVQLEAVREAADAAVGPGGVDGAGVGGGGPGFGVGHG